jgi:di/tricarboxylate transporter
MTDISIVFLILGVIVVLFVWNRLPVEIVAIGAALALAATGVLTVNQAFAGFGDTTVIFIAALFVISEGIDSTGVTTWAGQRLIDHAGDNRSRLLILTLLLVAVLTAVISVNGAVAALLPMVVVIAIRLGQPSSRLLMPLAFGAHAGSLLALTGTPVHILVSEASVDAGELGFNYFEFALVGLPIVAGVIAIVVLFGSKLLPDRTADTIPPDLSGHARTLYEQYSHGSWAWRLEVLNGSPLLGVAPSDIRLPESLTLVGVQGSDRDVVGTPLVVGDVLSVRGEPEEIASYAEDSLLQRRPGSVEGEGSLINRQLGVVEVVIPPRSELIGEAVFPGMVTSSGDFVVLAVQRKGQFLESEPTELAAGDTMLLQGTWDALDRSIDADPDIRVVDSPALVRRQAVPMGPRSISAVVILVAMVFLLATGLLPAAVAALLAAGAMILSGVVTLPQAYRSISWTTVILVGALIPLSKAVEETGAAEGIAEVVVNIVGDSGPHALLLAIFVLTAVFGQLISNMATALIVIPIAVTAANEIGVSARPVLMTLTIAAAAAFLTPVATPANLMVMGPGGYEFRDYWKLGLPMLILFGMVAVFLVPVFWPF